MLGFFVLFFILFSILMEYEHADSTCVCVHNVSISCVLFVVIIHKTCAACLHPFNENDASLPFIFRVSFTGYCRVKTLSSYQTRLSDEVTSHRRLRWRHRGGVTVLTFVVWRYVICILSSGAVSTASLPCGFIFSDTIHNFRVCFSKA